MKKASLTEKIINDYADVIKWGAGQVVDTYQEIDLYLLRGRNLDEKRKNLLLVLDMLDDDIEIIRKMQADVRKALAVHLTRGEDAPTSSGEAARWRVH